MTGAIVVSLMSFTSPVAIWLIANQIQLISLLLLTGSYLPLSVKKLLTGSKFMTLSFSFIPVMDIPGISIPLKALNIEQDDLDLKEMGINSGSSFIANFMFLLIILSIILLHLLFSLIPKCKVQSDEKCMRKFFRKFRNVIDNFLGFAIYARLFIEAFQIILLSSVSEINVSNTHFRLLFTMYSTHIVDHLPIMWLSLIHTY